MKRLPIWLIASLSLCGRYAHAETPSEYIMTYAKLAVSEMERTGIPASIILAQGILESGSGQSELAVSANNHFAIKAFHWNGSVSRKHYDRLERSKDRYRAYRCAEESYRDHSDFLKTKRYKPLFSINQTDYVSWAYGLRACKYATDPAYPKKLIRMIERHSLYFYDRLTSKDMLVLEIFQRIRI